MDSLLRLCAHRVVAQCSLPTIPAHLYPVLFQAAFRDGRHLFLWYLVATWPFKELHVRQLVGHLELHWDHRSIISVQAIIQAVVAQLQRKLEEPSSDSRWVLEIPAWPQPPIPPGILMVSLNFFPAEAQTQAAQRMLWSHHSHSTAPRRGRPHRPVRQQKVQQDRARCTPDWSLRPSAHQVPQISTKVHLSIRHREFLPSHNPTIPRMQSQLSFPRNPDIPSTHQSSLGSHLSLFPPTSNLQTPLESLELPFCSLIPDDLAFLSQSFHAPALKRLKLSSYDISQGLLEPLRLLLEKASASLLHLDLSYCYIADSHLAVLLPTLLRCSRLRFLGLNSNPLSRAAIKDLLQKTLELPNLHLVVYPYPLDCYTGDPSAFEWHLGEFVDAEILAAAKSEFFQILVNSGRTDILL
uniref:Leucine-rich repeat-containing protein 14 n=1 Tax=Catharus ustulatus TaxID=91951 RepID=A0A8C3U0V7_CATUS